MLGFLGYRPHPEVHVPEAGAARLRLAGPALCAGCRAGRFRGLRSSGIRANASIFFLNLLGLPNALIYAGVWPLAIRGLGRYTKLGSSLLIMGLCGNAILPLLYGFVAQHWGMRTGYWVLIPCFLYLLFFALKGYRIEHWPWQRAKYRA